MNTQREDLLADAAKIIAGDRDKQYGGPEESFTITAKLWNVHLSKKTGRHVELDPGDVALMMMMLKTARLVTGGLEQRDTWLDAAGYAACGWEVSSFELHGSPE